MKPARAGPQGFSTNAATVPLAALAPLRLRMLLYPSYEFYHLLHAVDLAEDVQTRKMATGRLARPAMPLLI